MKNYWVYALFTKGDIIREGEITKDGLLVHCSRFDFDIELAQYPYHKECWYFNSSFDRIIAEHDFDDDLITANPQLIWRAGYKINT